MMDKKVKGFAGVLEQGLSSAEEPPLRKRLRKYCIQKPIHKYCNEPLPHYTYCIGCDLWIGFPL